MITPVNFEIAKLLKEKGYPLSNVGYGYAENGNLVDPCFGTIICEAPTIAEVVMWLYEKHNLWILPLPTITGYFAYKIVDVQLNPDKPIERPPYKDVSAHDYSTPTEAYEAAIEYTLNNLI